MWTKMFFPILVFLALSARKAQAAEWTIKPGDTLEKIAKATGHTVEQLTRMNHLPAPDKKYLKLRTKINYISNQDIEDATKWLERIIRYWSDTRLDIWAQVYQRDLEALQKREIEYDFGVLNPEVKKIYWGAVLIHADAWRRELKK